jgi:conjugal transfer pilus assembly protein TraV
MTRTHHLMAPLVALTLTGCSSFLSGVGGKDTYACKAPPGAVCTSISGVYANTAPGSTRQLRVADQSTPTTGAKTGNTTSKPTPYGATTPSKSAHSTASATAHPDTPSPLRSAPRLLRIWIAPWEDSDGDLHEEAYVHAVVDPGRWLVEHVRPATVRERDGAIAPVPSAMPADTRPRDESVPTRPPTFGPSLNTPSESVTSTRKER